MSKDESGRVASRRRILKILAGSAGAAIPASAVPPARADEISSLVPHVWQAARLATTAASSKIFSPGELETLAAVCETIIPTDEHSPGAKAAGVPSFIEAILAEAGDEQKTFWKQGLAAVEAVARRVYGTRFPACTPGQQEALLLKTSANENNPQTLEERFFVAAKRVTIEGYYNSKVGIHQDVEYQGNNPLEEFRGCEHPKHGQEKQGVS